MSAFPAIALIVFNRPDCTRRVLEAIRSARPTRLFVTADGPRATEATDGRLCAEARAVVDEGVDWPCEVSRNYAEKNLGCAERVASGLNWVFAQVDEAVVLEDDCVPRPEFLPFCDDLLAHYREDQRVGAIAGSNFQSRDVTQGRGYYFSRYPHCWGWATWKRAWSKYDHRMADWPEAKRSGWLGSLFDSPREMRYWEAIFDRVHAGEIDSWAYRWTYTCWRQDLLTALPAANLVENIGFGVGATHTARALPPFRLPRRSQTWPLHHGAAIARNVAADRHTAIHHFDPPLWLRAWRKLAGPPSAS